MQDLLKVANGHISWSCLMLQQNHAKLLSLLILAVHEATFSPVLLTFTSLHLNHMSEESNLLRSAFAQMMLITKRWQDDNLWHSTVQNEMHA
ncbi:hypothetical protein BaRGS_00018321 [Batillaria attramentaria]|uniref:Uncharacterized protein n=1 Tax=Batillaria attramentaria TaxID=370345 RepID=A0ABD0KT43_9CAEN